MAMAPTETSVTTDYDEGLVRETHRAMTGVAWIRFCPQVRRMGSVGLSAALSCCDRDRGPSWGASVPVEVGESR